MNMQRSRFISIVFCVALLLATAKGVSAQKLSGSIAQMKGQKEVNLVIDFSGVMVNNQPEESHIAHSTKDKTEAETAQWLKNGTRICVIALTQL